MPLHSAFADRYHSAIDPHRRSTWLSDVVLGGQDGLVNVLGIVLGVGAATESSRIVFIAGLSAALAESVSMASVAYTSSRTRGEVFRGEEAREERHVELVPDIERREIREIYARKGFSGDLLEEIVRTITSDKKLWVAEMMSSEHGLRDVETKASLRAATVVGAASLVGSMIPLLPYLILQPKGAGWMAMVLGLLLLFVFGAYKARRTVGHSMRGGLELAAIGAGSSLAGAAVGFAFRWL